MLNQMSSNTKHGQRLLEFPCNSATLTTHNVLGGRMAKRKLVEIDFGAAGKHTAEDVEFDIVKEDWNSYRLEDGAIVKCRLVPSQMFRAVDESGKYILTDDGEPMVSVSATVLIRTKE